MKILLKTLRPDTDFRQCPYEGPGRKLLCNYGKDKLASEGYLMDRWREDGFLATVVMPGQISGYHWDVIGPWGTVNLTPFQKVTDGDVVELPNFGMEALHHVHGYDVAQAFALAMRNRDAGLRWFSWTDFPYAANPSERRYCIGLM